MPSKSGGTLKRSTGRMKIHHMNMVVSFKDRLSEAQDAEAKRKRKEELDALEWVSIENCIALEGSDSFWKWYNDDENVPAHGLHKDRIAQIEARVTNLKGARS